MRQVAGSLYRSPECPWPTPSARRAELAQRRRRVRLCLCRHRATARADWPLFPKCGRPTKWPTFAFRRHPQPKIAPQPDLTLSSALSGTPVIAAMLSGLVPRDLVLRCHVYLWYYSILFTDKCPKSQPRTGHGQDTRTRACVSRLPLYKSQPRTPGVFLPVIVPRDGVHVHLCPLGMSARAQDAQPPVPWRHTVEGADLHGTAPISYLSS